MGIAGAYRLGPESGRLLVPTTRVGLGAKAGHDLTIEVTCLHGRATVDAATPANSSVAVEVDADSLEVREGTVTAKGAGSAEWFPDSCVCNLVKYRRRLLLHCDVRWQTHRTARLRGRSPRLAA
jgi:hypothetical protein